MALIWRDSLGLLGGLVGEGDDILEDGQSQALGLGDEMAVL